MKIWKHNSRLYCVYQGNEVEGELERNAELRRTIVVQIQFQHDVKMKFQGKVWRRKGHWAIADSNHCRNFKLENVVRVYVEQKRRVAS